MKKAKSDMLKEYDELIGACEARVKNLTEAVASKFSANDAGKSGTGRKKQPEVK
jgi:hypothetical protein